MEKRIKELEKKLNEIWEQLPEKPTYGQFNEVFSYGHNVEELRKFEKKNHWMGIARYDTPNEGISVISLIASITDFLTDGWRLSFIMEGIEGTDIEQKKIVGFKFIKEE